MKVLILCTGNSARSQMAEAILRHLTGRRAEVSSAGTRPQRDVHPLARETMIRLYGLDTTGQFPKKVDQFIGRPFDYVITVCDHAAETCPVFPGNVERIHWSFEDPAAAEGDEAARRAKFEAIARQIHAKFSGWLGQPDVMAKL